MLDYAVGRYKHVRPDDASKAIGVQFVAGIAGDESSKEQQRH